ncbi:MAG: serine/threonine-protein kinase, partial [Pirellula sp.]
MIQPENNQVNATSSPSLLSGDELVQQLCESLELRILAGENVRSEAFLSEFPAIANDPEQAMDLIYTEFVARTEMGELPCADEFFVRFPHWRNQLQRQFQLAEALDNSPMYIRANESLNENSQGLSNVGMDRRFRIGKLLARGGIGQVMHATDMELHREVAVKEILPHLAQNLDVRERFLREAEITGRLEHPGVVPVYGLGRDNQHRPFYAMRLVRGESFQEAINAFHEKYADRRRFHSIEFQKLLRRFLSVCETISYAHSRGVIHRDLKPHNVMLGPFGETLVVDWGLAKVIQLPPIHVETNTENPAVKNVNEASEIPLDPTDPTTSSANWSVDLTQTAGALIGSPAFMSPEQACGESHVVGPASDIYSLGATLHCLLTGKSRFGDSDVDETLRQLRAGNFARPRDLNRHVPRALEAICLKALSQEPPDRYSSPSALASDIEHWLADEPVSIYREPVVKRAGRWVRRNRTPAILGLIALILVSAISTLAAFRINGERLRADRERIEARRVSARLAFDRGYQLTEQHEYGQGLMW